MSTVTQYSDQEMVMLAIDIRTKFLALKDHIHSKGVRLQQKIRSRKELISDAKVFTEMRDMSIRALKEASRKESKGAKGKPSPLELVQIDDKLASFLELEKRGFSPIYDKEGNEVWYYSGNLMLSYFTNWVVSNNRQDGKNVRLLDNDPFIDLFGKDLETLGSAGQDKSVLDKDGNQINPFVSNRHMTIFAKHYPQKMRMVGKDYKPARVQISREDHPSVYEDMERERDLLTGKMGTARKEYRSACKKYEKMLDKQNAASEIGDRGFKKHLDTAYRHMADKTREYMYLLNSNKFTHNLKVMKS